VKYKPDMFLACFVSFIRLLRLRFLALFVLMKWPEVLFTDTLKWLKSSVFVF